MRVKSIFSLALRFLIAKKGEGGRSATLLGLIGVAVGVAGVCATMAVMNGLQQGYVYAILETNSYHARVESRGLLSALDREKLVKNPRVLGAWPTCDVQGLIRTPATGYMGITVRGLDRDAYDADEGLKNRLKITSGRYPEAGEILAGAELARNMGLRLEDTVTALVLAKGSTRPTERSYRVSGFFKTGYYQYDSREAFMPLADAVSGIASSTDIFYGVKLRRPNDAARFIRETSASIDAPLSGWEEYDPAFFGALKLEKHVTVLLLSLIFAVAAVTIHRGRRRDIAERVDELAYLRALGLRPGETVLIFCLHGLFIGLPGAIGGWLVGFALAKNASEILDLLRRFINLFIQIGIKMGMSLAPMELLSGGSFYLDGIPSAFPVADNVAVVAAAAGFSLLAAVLAARRLSAIKPAEILRGD